MLGRKPGKSTKIIASANGCRPPPRTRLWAASPETRCRQADTSRVSSVTDTRAAVRHANGSWSFQAHQEETAMYLTKKTTMVTRRIVLLAASLIAAAGIAAAAAPGAAAPHPHSAVALPPGMPPGSGDVA